MLYPDAHCELDFTSPLELLVATILSAQTTDKRVNLVTPILFSRYTTAAEYAAADRDELEKIIQSTGFYHAKANSLIGLGQALCERFGGEVPPRLRDLVTLPGVGRKTANVVLGNAFDIPGITVDTHFGRLARRFGWTTSTEPEKVEAGATRATPPAVPARWPASALRTARVPSIRRWRRSSSSPARSRDLRRPEPADPARHGGTSVAA